MHGIPSPFLQNGKYRAIFTVHIFLYCLQQADAVHTLGFCNAKAKKKPASAKDLMVQMAARVGPTGSERAIRNLRASSQQMAGCNIQSSSLPLVSTLFRNTFLLFKFGHVFVSLDWPKHNLEPESLTKVLSV